MKRYEYRGSHKKGQREHIRIAETALGKILPKGVEVHHVNEDGLDNRHENLVICENRQYHRLLHLRQRIVDAGGDPNSDMIEPPNCIVPECQRRMRARGLCRSHYAYAHQLVGQGKTTWDELLKYGKILPSQPRSRFTKWLLSKQA